MAAVRMPACPGPPTITALICMAAALQIRACNATPSFSSLLPCLDLQVTILFGQAKRAMIRGTFQPRLDDRMVKCFQKLPWLQPLKELEGKPVDPQIFI